MTNNLINLISYEEEKRKEKKELRNKRSMGTVSFFPFPVIKELNYPPGFLVIPGGFVFWGRREVVF